MSTSVFLPQQPFTPFPAAPFASPTIAECSAYRARLAVTEEERFAAFRLRFLVFNIELNEGLASAYETGYDTDHFDDVCDHLIVEHVATGEIVGTYRIQSGHTAERFFG